MTQQTPAPKKPTKLTRRQQLDNLLFATAIPISSVIGFIWAVQMWARSYTRWHKKHPEQWFKPQLPRLITVWLISDEPQTPTLYRLLAMYHVRYFRFSYLWVIQDNHVGLTLQLLINPSLYDQVDSVLFNGAEGLWAILSAPGLLRHVQFRPHNQVDQVQRRTSPRSAQSRQATLGKTYR